MFGGMGLGCSAKGGEPYGDELVANGDFSDGTTGWTLHAGTSLVGETLEYIATSDGAKETVSKYNAIPGTLGKIMRFEIELVSSNNPDSELYFYLSYGQSVYLIDDGNGLWLSNDKPKKPLDFQRLFLIVISTFILN